MFTKSFLSCVAFVVVMVIISTHSLPTSKGACRTMRENEEWDLKPFCGRSICIKGTDGTWRERISDCGPPAKVKRHCRLIFNATLPYPDCCPVYRCAPGF